MFLREFAENRNIKANTVTAYIKSHEKDFKGHTWLKEGKKWIDDIALEILEKKYPAPKPVQVIEDSDSRRQLIEAQQLIIQLQQQLVEAAPKIAWAEQNQILLEAAIEEKEKLRAENAEYAERLKEKELQLEAEKKLYEKTIFGLYRKKK